MPIYGICVCNVVMVMGKKDYMWELLGDSHPVAIQWVHMGVDPLLCVCTNIVTIVLPLVEARGLKDHTYYYLTNLTPSEVEFYMQWALCCSLLYVCFLRIASCDYNGMPLQSCEQFHIAGQ